MITGLIGGWWPDRSCSPGLELAVAVVIVVALSLLGSVFLSATANGIAVFMVFGGGLVAGLLGPDRPGDRLGHAALDRPLGVLGAPVRGALPGRAARDHLGDDRLRRASRSSSGRSAARTAAASASSLWAVAYLLLVGAAGLAAFARRDLP